MSLDKREAEAGLQICVICGCVCVSMYVCMYDIHTNSLYIFFSIQRGREQQTERERERETERERERCMYNTGEKERWTEREG